MTKRVRFTKRELELISDMVGVAEAGPESEGDYQEWGEREYKALKTLAEKVYVLQSRKKPS